MCLCLTFSNWKSSLFTHAAVAAERFSVRTKREAQEGKKNNEKLYTEKRVISLHRTRRIGLWFSMFDAAHGMAYKRINLICFGCRRWSANSAQYEIHFIGKCNRSIHSAHAHFSTAKYHLNRYTNQLQWWSQCMQTIIFSLAYSDLPLAKWIYHCLFHFIFDECASNKRKREIFAKHTSDSTNSKLFRNRKAIF